MRRTKKREVLDRQILEQLLGEWILALAKSNGRIPTKEEFLNFLFTCNRNDAEAIALAQKLDSFLEDQMGLTDGKLH
ncbi:MAG: hypothetical protein ACXVB9_04565 [Bdellovibrionota bacterium]